MCEEHAIMTDDNDGDIFGDKLFCPQDANKRLGNLRNGAQDVKKHR